QAEDGIRDRNVTGVQTCALPILLLLPELATCGYIPKDMLRHQSFLDEIYAMNAALAALVTDMTVIVGSITTNNGGTGRNCFNSRSEERRVGKGGRSRRWRWE